MEPAHMTLVGEMAGPDRRTGRATVVGRLGSVRAVDVAAGEVEPGDCATGLVPARRTGPVPDSSPVATV